MKRLKEFWKKDRILLHSYYDKLNDILCVVTKSIETGKKYIHNIKSPLVPVYIIKKDVNLDHYKDHASIKDEIVTHWVPEKFRVFAIADILGIKNFAERLRNGTMKANEIFLHKRVIGSDKDITDLVLRSYVEEFTEYSESGYPIINVPNFDKFHLGAFDIETDVNVCPGEIDDMDARRKQPINIVTYIDNQSWEIRTIMLRNKDYAGQREVEKDIEQFERDLKTLLYENVNNLFMDDPSVSNSRREDTKKIIYPIIEKLKLNLTFTNSEKSLIKDISAHMFNNVNPDILYIYNASYDLMQMKLRCEELGINYDKLFKYQDLKESTDFRMESKGGYKAPSHRVQTYSTNNPTKIIDQMLQYYQLRRSKNFAKYSLDATAEREIGTCKLKWPKHITNFGDRVYYDCARFIMYNIIDVLLMLFLDMITFDTFTLVYKRYNMITEWERIGKPMPRTTNAMDYFSYLQGYITASEINPLLINMDDEMLDKLSKKDKGLLKVVDLLKRAYKNTLIDDKSKRDQTVVVPGGAVSSPNKISTKIKDNGPFGNINVRSYNKQGLCADDDAKAMYPNNNVANNASKATLFGRIKTINDQAIPDIDIKLAMGIINDNKSTIGNILYNLPTAEQLLEKHYNIKQTYLQKYNIKNINKENLILDPPADYKGLASSYISMWRQCYRTSYDVADIKAGNPENRQFIISDDKVIEFSYYGTKVTITTDTPTTTWFGVEGTGLTCGHYVSKDNSIENTYDQYVEYIIPNNDDPEFGLPEAEGILDDSILFNLSKSKYTTMDIEFGEHKLSMLDRALFTNYKTTISWSIHSIVGNSKCKMLRLISKPRLHGSVTMTVEQKIIFYDMRGE